MDLFDICQFVFFVSFIEWSWEWQDDLRSHLVHAQVSYSRRTRWWRYDYFSMDRTLLFV